jgi:hypothetical protein
MKIRQTLAEQDKLNSGWQREFIVSLYKVGTTAAKIGGNDGVTQAQRFLGAAVSLAELYSDPDRQNLIDLINRPYRTWCIQIRMRL